MASVTVFDIQPHVVIAQWELDRSVLVRFVFLLETRRNQMMLGCAKAFRS